MGPMGPLPQLYRLLIAGVVVVLGVAGGVWLAGWLALPLGGVGVGLVGGLLLAATISSRRVGIWRESAPLAVLAVIAIGYFSLDSAGGSGCTGSGAIAACASSSPTQSPVARYCTFLAMPTAWSAKRSW